MTPLAKSDTPEASFQPLSLKGRLGIIGAGVMGKAILKGLLGRGVVHPDQLWAVEASEANCEKVTEELGIDCALTYDGWLNQTDVILVCVKPAGVGKVLARLRQDGVKKETLVISIAAGVSIEQLETMLGTENPVIRAMPNTPCVVSQGMTAICAGTHASKAHMAIARNIFEAVGQCLALDETHFDAVTGLSGSGPAYIYLIIEALADGGVNVGLPRDVALKIVLQTVLGAATMVQKTKRHPAALRDDVTTPAGCTISALLTMEDGKIRSVLARAVEQAALTASQLGKPKDK